MTENVGGRNRGDRLRRRIPEANHAAPIDEQNAVGDVGDDPRGVRALLDCAVEPSAIDREGDPAGDVLGESEVVRAVRLAGLSSRKGQRSERPFLGSERDADGRARVDSAENRALLAAVRGLAESRNDLEAARLDDSAHRFLGHLIRSERGFLAQELRPRDGESLERAPVFDHVDDAPVGVVPNGELGDPLDRAPIVGRRGQHLARLAHEVEAPLPLHGPGRGLALGRQQPLALLVGALPLADVDEQRLRVEGLPFGAANGRHLLAHPHDSAAARQKPVFRRPRRCPGRLPLRSGEHLVLVVGVQELAEELRIVLPLGGRVAEQLFDLRADVRDRAPIVRRRDQGHERESLHEGAVPALGLVHPFGCVGDDCARGDDSAAVGDRRKRHRDDELLTVPAPLSEVAPVDPLALGHSLEGGPDVSRILFRAEERDVCALDVLRAVAVDPFGPSIPAQDLALEVEPDNRLDPVAAEGVQLTGVAPALSLGSTQAVGHEPGQDRRREPERQRDDRPRGVVDDEDEEERPASRGDQCAPPRPDEERDRGCDQERQRGRGLRRGDIEQPRMESWRRPRARGRSKPRPRREI